MDCKLRLYISGISPPRKKAVNNLKNFFKEYRPSCTYKIIDILKNPQFADKENFLATPVLVKVGSKNSKRIVGDLSELEKVFSELNISLEKNWQKIITYPRFLLIYF